MITIKLQIFDNKRRVEKAVYHGATVRECIEKFYKEMTQKGSV